MREKFKRFWDTANPDLLRLVIIFVLVGLLLAGFLLFGRSGSSGSVLPAWVQAEHVEPPDERLAAAQKESPTQWRGLRFPARISTRLCSSTETTTIICAVMKRGSRITTAASMPTMPAAWTAV